MLMLVLLVRLPGLIFEFVSYMVCNFRPFGEPIPGSLGFVQAFSQNTSRICTCQSTKAADYDSTLASSGCICCRIGPLALSCNHWPGHLPHPPTYTKHSMITIIHQC